METKQKEKMKKSEAHKGQKKHLENMQKQIKGDSQKRIEDEKWKTGIDTDFSVPLLFSYLP